ncbi:hypothetical protein [Segetibacter koreensis]|uniref:hypothetical protein n=1 Tax=Segetibacter koreensis TaxID=398037 RepID=UPI000379146D|nr:hypothetical protein [Segetibacter koreensis]
MSEYRNRHLDCVLKSHNIENNEDLMTAYRNKRGKVREDLKKKFEGEIYQILHSGSYKKFTAVNIKFDMDLVVPFSKDEADALEKIYNDLYKYYDTEYRKKDTSLLEVKAQKVAIGLTFFVDGKLLDLDIVPGREINDYEKDGDLNLFVNDRRNGNSKATTLKTNIEKQIDNIRNNSVARETIKLFKIWKRRNNGQIKSFVIELIVIKALEGYAGASDRWSKLKHVLTYIRDNIKTVRLVDPGNTNNIVSDSLEDFQKNSISETSKWMLEDLEKNEKSIERYFPVNTEYPCKEENKSAYIIGASKKPDQLNDEDFG